VFDAACEMRALSFRNVVLISESTNCGTASLVLTPTARQRRFRCTEIGLPIDTQHNTVAVFAAMLLRRRHRFRLGPPGRVVGRPTGNTDSINVAWPKKKGFFSELRGLNMTR
jgi:hypothetical protein